MTDFVLLLKKVIDEQPLASPQLRCDIYTRMRAAYVEKLSNTYSDQAKINEELTKFDLSVEKVELDYSKLDNQIDLLEQGVIPQGNLSSNAKDKLEDNINYEKLFSECETKLNNDTKKNTKPNKKRNLFKKSKQNIDLAEKWGVDLSESDKSPRYLLMTWWPFILTGLGILIFLFWMLFRSSEVQPSIPLDPEYNISDIQIEKNTSRLLPDGTEEDVPLPVLTEDEADNATISDDSINDNTSLITVYRVDTDGQLDSPISGEVNWSLIEDPEGDDSKIIATINLDSIGEVANITFQNNKDNETHNPSMLFNFALEENLDNGTVTLVDNPFGRLTEDEKGRPFIGNMRKHEENDFKFLWSRSKVALSSNLELLLNMKYLDILVTLKDNSRLLFNISISEEQSELIREFYK